MSSPEPKHIVEIKTLAKPMPIPKEAMESVKGAIGGRIVSRMKKEALDCPVRSRQVSFVECFVCGNFLRRVKGKIHCKGEAST